jgi:mono/diheme cytochrome c family protein
MKRPHRLALAFVAAAAVPAASYAQQAAAASAGEAEVEAGRKLYISSCQRCHGINLVTNGIGFDLRTFPRTGKERFVRSVTEGVRAMPAWGTTLKPEQLDLIWAYVGAVNGWEGTPAPR